MMVAVGIAEKTGRLMACDCPGSGSLGAQLGDGRRGFFRISSVPFERGAILDVVMQVGIILFLSRERCRIVGVRGIGHDLLARRWTIGDAWDSRRPMMGKGGSLAESGARVGEMLPRRSHIRRTPA